MRGLLSRASVVASVSRSLTGWTLVTERLELGDCRVDIHRVLVLRTVSNYDREAPGETPAESLKRMATGNYPAFVESLEAAETVGDKVVRDIVQHWDERESKIPGAP